MPDTRGLSALTEIESAMIDDELYSSKYKDETIYVGTQGGYKVVWHGLHHTTLEQMKIISDYICEKQDIVARRAETYADALAKLEEENRRWGEEERRIDAERLKAEHEKRERKIETISSKRDRCSRCGEIYGLHKCDVCGKFYCNKCVKLHCCPNQKPLQITPSKNERKIEERQPAELENVVANGMVDSSPSYLLEDTWRWFVNHVPHVLATLFLIVVVGAVVLNGSSAPHNDAVATPILATPLPTVATITPINSYIGVWVGQDGTAENTITIMPNGKFGHKITSSGAVRYFTGTYTQQWNGLLLQYDNFAPGVNYNANMNMGDNTATLAANGYVPDMPVSLKLTRRS
jgi:hypothetical protein